MSELDDREKKLVQAVDIALVALCAALKSSDDSGLMIQFNISDNKVTDFKVRKPVEYLWPLPGGKPPGPGKAN